jgi:hypothetical protein|tara:strand:- start:46 stop:354 length:309 start_codon:yes stop_codon:yes gene_type:complete
MSLRFAWRVKMVNIAKEEPISEDEEEFIKNWLSLEERLKAPEGQFKVIEVDKFSQPFEADSEVGIFDTIDEARSVQLRLELGNDSDEVEYLIYNDKGFMEEG